VEIEPDTRALKSLVGDCAAPDAPGSVQLTLPALGYVACVETAP
jgi:hypothetical protein